MAMNRTARVSAVIASGVGVYWGSNLSNSVSEINWGNLTPGSTKSIVVYVRNEAEEPTNLNLSTANWDPSEASRYLNLGWDYSRRQIGPSESLKISLTLSVSHYIEGVSSFFFDIHIAACGLLCDVNGDNKINYYDWFAMADAYGSKLGDDNWDERCDFNDDNKVNYEDLFTFVNYWLPI